MERGSHARSIRLRRISAQDPKTQREEEEDVLTRESGDAPDIMGKKKRFSRRDAKPPRGEEDGA